MSTSQATKATYRAALLNGLAHGLMAAYTVWLPKPIKRHHISPWEKTGQYINVALCNALTIKNNGGIASAKHEHIVDAEEH